MDLDARLGSPFMPLAGPADEQVRLLEKEEEEEFVVSFKEGNPPGLFVCFAAVDDDESEDFFFRGAKKGFALVVLVEELAVSSDLLVADFAFVSF